MRDRLEDVAARAVHLRERDERAPQVVPAPAAQLDELEVAAERVRGLLHLAHSEAAARHDEVVCFGRAAVGGSPAGELPGGEHLRERVVHRDEPRYAGLRALPHVAVRDRQAPQRLRGCVVVRPLQACGLAVTKAGEHLQGVEHAAVNDDPLIGDQRLRFFAREHRGRPPLGVLVRRTGQGARRQDRRVGGDELVDHGVTEHRAKRRVHVPDCPGRELPLGLERQHQVAEMPRAHVGERHRAQPRQRMQAETTLFVGIRSDAVLAAREPMACVCIDGDTAGGGVEAQQVLPAATATDITAGAVWQIDRTWGLRLDYTTRSTEIRTCATAWAAP